MGPGQLGDDLADIERTKRYLLERSQFNWSYAENAPGAVLPLCSGMPESGPDYPAQTPESGAKSLIIARRGPLQGECRRFDPVSTHQDSMTADAKIFLSTFSATVKLPIWRQGSQCDPC